MPVATLGNFGCEVRPQWTSPAEAPPGCQGSEPCCVNKALRGHPVEAFPTSQIKRPRLAIAAVPRASHDKEAVLIVKEDASKDVAVVLKAAGSAEPLWVSHWAAPEPHRQGGHRGDDNRPYEEPGLCMRKGVSLGSKA